MRTILVRSFLLIFVLNSYAPYAPNSNCAPNIFHKFLDDRMDVKTLVLEYVVMAFGVPISLIFQMENGCIKEDEDGPIYSVFNNLTVNIHDEVTFWKQDIDVTNKISKEVKERVNQLVKIVPHDILLKTMIQIIKDYSKDYSLLEKFYCSIMKMFRAKFRGKVQGDFFFGVSKIITKTAEPLDYITQNKEKSEMRNIMGKILWFIINSPMIFSTPKVALPQEQKPEIISQEQKPESVQINCLLDYLIKAIKKEWIDPVVSHGLDSFNASILKTENMNECFNSSILDVGRVRFIIQETFEQYIKKDNSNSFISNIFSFKQHVENFRLKISFAKTFWNGWGHYGVGVDWGLTRREVMPYVNVGMNINQEWVYLFSKIGLKSMMISFLTIEYASERFQFQILQTLFLFDYLAFEDFQLVFGFRLTKEGVFFVCGGVLTK